MSEPRSEERRVRVGYVLKKYPRVSETFILNEILGLEATGGADVAIFSLNMPDDGRFHADLARVRGAVEYSPAFGSAATLAAFRTLAELGDVAPAALRRALDFVDLLPAERRTVTLVQAMVLAKRVCELRLDHLHAHFLTVAAHVAMLAHVMTEVPFSVTAHAKDIYRETVDARVFRAVAAAASTIVTVSDFNRRHIDQTFLHDLPARSRRIYNGQPLEDFEQHGQPREPGLVLGVGRLVEKKGFDVLLGACRLMADRGERFRCVIVGEGEERESLAGLRRSLALESHVELAGVLPRDQVIALMQRARVLAAPCVRGSDGNQDALPTVLVEALAAGLPSVSTRLSGIPEIVEHGRCGLLVAERDPAAVAEAVSRLLHDDALWAVMSAAGPVKARARFDRRATIQELLGVFRGAVATSATEARP